VSRAGSERSIRALDVTVAAATLVITAPLWPLVACAIKLDSRGPVLYRSPRLGRAGREFEMLKFRTMTTGSAGLPITANDDPRITRVGRVLREAKLDELPQLVNVLRGDMGLVGPRPEAPVYLPHLDGELRELLQWRPGITGAASTAYRHEEQILAEAADPEAFYVSELLPAKAHLDLEYCRTRTVWTDVAMLAKTVKSVVRLRG